MQMHYIVIQNLVILRDKTQENPRELEASEFDLNYVPLEGNIGCNGKWRWVSYGNYGYHQIIWWQTS